MVRSPPTGVYSCLGFFIMQNSHIKNRVSREMSPVIEIYCNIISEGDDEMLTYFYNMGKRMEKLLGAVIEMNSKYDLLLEKLDRIETLLSKTDCP